MNTVFDFLTLDPFLGPHWLLLLGLLADATLFAAFAAGVRWLTRRVCKVYISRPPSQREGIEREGAA